LPDFPFGTDLTDDELHIVRALKKLKHASQHPIAELLTMAVKSLWDGKEAPKAYLERLGLATRTASRTLWCGRLLAGKAACRPSTAAARAACSTCHRPRLRHHALGLPQLCRERRRAAAARRVARGRLVGQCAAERVGDLPPAAQGVGGNGHFGSRLVFRRDKTLFVALGERQKGSPAQDLGSHLGKVVRINRDGSIPADNPRRLRRAAGPVELWPSQPAGGGAAPGDRRTVAQRARPAGRRRSQHRARRRNFGWPERSYGCNYGARGRRLPHRRRHACAEPTSSR
jgi:hypothetical protein